MRVVMMVLCFGFAGLNIWFMIPPQHGSALNAIAVMVALGSGVYTMASLIKFP